MSDVPAIKQTTEQLQQFLVQNQVSPTEGGGKPFLAFDSKRTGDWLIGQDRESCTGEVVAIDVLSLKHGYILWHQRKANRRMVPINQPLPAAQEPVEWTDSKGQLQVDEASESRAFDCTFDDGLEAIFETSTYGGRAGVDDLLKELFARAAQGSPYLYPHVKLETSSYDHAQYGKVYTPVLTPVAWYDAEGNAEKAGAKRIAKEPAEAPKVAEPEPEQADESEPEPDEKPQRRRRRRPTAA